MTSYISLGGGATAFLPNATSIEVITDGTNFRLDGSVNYNMAPSDTLKVILDTSGIWWEQSRAENSLTSVAYTPTNVSTDRAFDANAGTLTASAVYAQGESQAISDAVSELADVVGTLISDLQSKKATEESRLCRRR